jgi:anionic cell wall polymer biosynthesis LytR-Cps2A-Psr (LCP) family protein
LRKKKKLEFKTKRRAETEKKKRVFLIFLVVLLVFGAISSFVLLRSIDFNLSNLFEGREDETQSGESTTKAVPLSAGISNYLAFCVSEDAKEIRFVAVINTDPANLKIRVCTLSPDTTAKYEDEFLTLAEHFIKGGAPQMVKAIEHLGGIAISRYAYSTDKGFKSALKTVDAAGKLSLHIEETINHRDDKFSIFIPSGKQSMNAEKLLNYFIYCGGLGDNGRLMQARAIIAMLDFFMTGANAEKGEALYGLLYNSMAQTDITGIDFNNSKAAIDLLVERRDALVLSIEQNLTLFTAAAEGKEEVSS